jgi:predicted ATPase
LKCFGALVETKALAGERGRYRVEKTVDALQIPLTAQAILAARIDRLRPEDKQLLQAASVIGKDVPFPLLSAIAEVQEGGLRQSLARLQAAEFLYETKIFPDLEHTFKHALTQDVAYGSLLQDRRRALHVRIVQTIEAWSRERLDEQVEQLAYHALKGEVWAQTLTYSRRAGIKALARSADPEAVAYFDQALAALGHLPLAEPESGKTRAACVRVGSPGRLVQERQSTAGRRASRPESRCRCRGGSVGSVMTRVTVCRSHPRSEAMRVLNCPCCFRNYLIVLRAMAVSTLLPSAIEMTSRGDSAPVDGASRQRKGGAN